MATQDSTDIGALSSFLLELYRDARSEAPHLFQTRTLAQLREVISFDFAAWGGGAERERLVTDVIMLDQSARLFSAWAEVAAEDAFCDLALKRINHTVTFDDVQGFRNSTAWNEHWRRFDAHNMVSTITAEPLDGYVTFLGSCNADPARPFRERDRRINGDLFCGEAGKCEPLRIDGEHCAVNRQCFSRSCNAGKCTSPQLGDPCIEGIYCGDGLRCMDGKCALLGKVGDACSQVHDEFPVCTYDAECVDGRCEAISRCGEGQLGSVCSSSAQCAEGFNCSPVEDRCVKRANEGEVCSADHVHCAEGLRCELKDFEDDGSCQKGAPAAPPAAQLCE